jgi:hypothetical protein
VGRRVQHNQQVDSEKLDSERVLLGAGSQIKLGHKKNALSKGDSVNDETTARFSVLHDHSTSRTARGDNRTNLNSARASLMMRPAVPEVIVDPLKGLLFGQEISLKAQLSRFKLHRNNKSTDELIANLNEGKVQPKVVNPKCTLFLTYKTSYHGRG